MFRRHPYLTITGLLSAIFLLVCIIFLATFDLNRYRASLQSSLGEALARPVLLGEAELSWHFGPTFDFTHIEIGGKDDEPPLLKADRLYLKPKMLPLLLGRIDLAEIVFNNPALAFDLTASETSHTNSLQTFLTAIHADSIIIRQGNIRITDRRHPEAPFEIEIHQVSLQAKHIFSASRGRLRLEALLVQPDGNADLKLGGTLALSPHQETWRKGQVNLTLSLQGLVPGPFITRYAKDWGIAGAEGQMGLQTSLTGSLADGLQFSGNLKGDNLTLQLPESHETPLSLGNFAFSGKWTATDQLYSFNDLAIQLDDLSLSGHFTLQRKTREPWLEGGLSSGELALSEIWRLLPDQFPDLPLKSLKSRIPDGTLRLTYARFAGPLSNYQDFKKKNPLQAAEAQVRGVLLDLGNKQHLHNLSGDLVFEDGHLNLFEGHATLLGSPLSFSGSLENPFDAGVKTTISAGWILPTDRLSELWPEKTAFNSGDLGGKGPIPLTLTLNGQGQDYTVGLRANLDACSLTYRSAFNKPSGTPGSLEINGRLTPELLEINNSLLHLGPIRLKATGRQTRVEKGVLLATDKQPFLIRYDLAETEVQEVGLLVPALHKLQSHGRISGHYTLEGTGSTVLQGDGNLTLKGLGLQLESIVKGKLHGFNGRVKLSREQIEWSGITGRLGENPIRISGTASGNPAPRIELQVAAEKILAGDLFFPSRQIVLRRLKGGLVFTEKEVLFDSIEVAIDDDVSATVNGNFRYEPMPTTMLDIRATRGNVDKVVALWDGPPTAPTAGSTHKKDLSTHKSQVVIVKAHVDQGSYGPLDFRDAVGTVTSTSEALSIDPIQFSLGKKGHGQCQINFSDRSDGHSWLKISGRIKDAPTDILNEISLLGKKGLLSGTLTGDYFLEGLAGDRFLETASGHFEVAVTDGVLYRFAFLSKVFSLLNVSQILTLKLPDMAREGMPFTNLQGSFLLDRGKLKTEDLFLTGNAMNMSLIGSVDLIGKELDLLLGVKPFRTVDKIVTHIPIAGWLLTGDEKALITAHFEITGQSDDPEVRPIPVTSLSSQALGIFKRILGLPGKAFTDPGGLMTGQGKDSAENAP